MKIKKTELVKIIKEEANRVLGEISEADPRVVAMQRAMDLLEDLQFDSLETAIDNMNTEVIRKLSIMIKELDYKRNQVGNLEEGENK